MFVVLTLCLAIPAQDSNEVMAGANESLRLGEDQS